MWDCAQYGGSQGETIAQDSDAGGQQIRREVIKATIDEGEEYNQHW